jgi:hypothetical protein
MQLLRQAEQRRLRMAVATAYRQHRTCSKAQTQANILLAEQKLTQYEVQQHQRQAAVSDALWEVYGDGNPSFWGYRLGKEIPEQQSAKWQLQMALQYPHAPGRVLQQQKTCWRTFMTQQLVASSRATRQMHSSSKSCLLGLISS